MTDFDLKQCALFISDFDSFSPKDFFKQLFDFKHQTYKEFLSNDKQICFVPFKIDNKYYEAEIKFLFINNQQKCDFNLFNGIDFICFLTNSEDENNIIKIEDKLKLFDNVDDKLVILQKSDHKNENKELLINWCSSNMVELIDLNEYDEDKINGDSNDYLVLERFLEIIDAHDWPNKILKIKKNTSIANTSKKNEENFVEKNNHFEDLFFNLKEFKDKANSLKGEERYNYAEQIANAFLKSMVEEE